jgi:hypothetical protein
VWPPWLVEERLDGWFGLSWPLVEHAWSADAGRTVRNEAAINAKTAISFMVRTFA